MGAEFEIQRALFQAISALGLPTQDVGRQTTSDALPPTAEVGAIVMAPLDTKDRNGFDFVARIHVRAKAHDLGAVKERQAAIYARLHNGDLAITGYNTILLRRELTDCLREADGHIHGICEYRGLIEAA